MASFYKILPLYFAKVTGNSMLPSLPPGSFLLASPLPYWFGKPKMGDVVLLTINGHVMVKRVATISQDSLNILGDNAAESTDSRSFGPILHDAILAKVLAKL